MNSLITTKQIWNVAYPIILGSVAQNILIVTDTAFLGSMGEIALGGGVIGALFYQVLLMLGWGISIGGQIIIARRYGEKKYYSIGQVVEHLFYFLMLFGLFLLVLVGTFSDSFFGYMVESDAVREAGSDFFHYRILGLLMAFVGYTFQAFYVGIARTKVITLTTVAMVATNIVFDYGLMFGNLGLPEMGVSGAALASVIAECVSIVTFFVFTLFRFNFKEYSLLRFSGFQINSIIKILKVGWPLMFEFSLSVFVWLVFFLLIEKMGETPLAISNIVRSMYNVIIIPVFGFASATNTFVSQIIGRGESDNVMSVVYKILKLSVLSVLVLSVLSLVFGRFAMQIFSNDVGLIDQALRVMHVVQVAALGMGAAFVLFNAVSGTGNTVVSFCIDVIALIFNFIWTYVMAIKLNQSLAVVWVAEIVYGVVTILLSLFYLKSKRWLGHKL